LHLNLAVSHKFALQTFDERAYQQPSLYDEPDRIAKPEAEVDSDVDVDGRLQLDEDGEVYNLQMLTLVLISLTLTR
jgi:hypothetical protein